MKEKKYKGKSNISGDRIREARTDAKISQETLAARLQNMEIWLNQSAICEIEKGKQIVADYELVAFAKILGKTVAWLVGEE